MTVPIVSIGTNNENEGEGHVNRVSFTLTSLPELDSDLFLDCIEWDRDHTKLGYGVISLGRENGRRIREYVHRQAWASVHGPIPKGMHVLHRCDNPPCFNVDHLFLGNQVSNMQDKKRKGRHLPSIKAQMKLTAIQVAEIRTRLAAGERVTYLAREFGVNHSNIHAIKIGRSWKRESFWAEDAWPK